MSFILIAFASRTGITQVVAERIGAVLLGAGHEATVVPVDDDPFPEAYDAVVLGTGTRRDRPLDSARAWVERHHDALQATAVGEFGVRTARSPHENDPAEATSPRWLLACDPRIEGHDACAAADATVDGAHPERLSPHEFVVSVPDTERRRTALWEGLRARMRYPSAARDADRLDWDEVDGWAQQVAARLNN